MYVYYENHYVTLKTNIKNQDTSQSEYFIVKQNYIEIYRWFIILDLMNGQQSHSDSRGRSVDKRLSPFPPNVISILNLY